MLNEVNKKRRYFWDTKKAGDEILKVYQEDDFQVEMKSDESPLTLADKKSNHIIVDNLNELFAEIPFE